jgi:two-component sensor histidine kinase
MSSAHEYPQEAVRPVASLALERLVRSPTALIECLPLGVHTCDRQGILIQFNSRAAELWGHKPALGDSTTRYCGAFRMFEPDGTPLDFSRGPVATVLSTTASLRDREVIVERPDGTRINVLANVEPLFDEAGNLVGALSCIQDISALTLAQQQQRSLVDELNHRVKNTLATVQSLAAQTLGSTAGVAARAFELRLLALSRTHDLLTRTQWASADLTDIARTICSPDQRHVRIDGMTVPLPPRIALSLAMVLHELVTNAVQHGALSSPDGSVDLYWRVHGDRLHLDWREQGGPTVSEPPRRGFGTRLFERTVVNELRGAASLDFNPSGVHCTMDIVLPR